jgi:hypothetical protein
MYLRFPSSQETGIELLHLRRCLLYWSEQNDILHTVHIEHNEFRVRLPEEQHYTLFALQWQGPEFYIQQQKIAA